MIRILLVDDQKSIREWLKSLLETEPDFEIVGMVDNGYDAIEQVKLLLPDVVLMDMEMPDIDGILATKIIADSSLKTKVLVLTSYDSQDYVTKSIYAGAKGYILKGAPTEEIREAIRFVNRGYMQIAPGLFEQFIPNHHNSGDVGVLEMNHREGNSSLVSEARVDYSGRLELTGIGPLQSPKTQAMVSMPDFDQPSELILDITALKPPRKSIGWYQATALVLAGLGLTGSVYMLRQGLSKPADVPDRQASSERLHDLPFTGKVEPLHVVKINAATPGFISGIQVKLGQTVNTGDRLLTIRNIDAERANQAKLVQHQEAIAAQKKVAFQEAAKQRQVTIGEQQAAVERVNSIQLEIANYQRNLAPLRQQIADATVQANMADGSTQPSIQKMEALTRAQAIYDRAFATYQRLAQYQNEGAISLERVEQAEKEMTVAKSDLNIAQSDYDNAIASTEAAKTKQTAQDLTVRLQQQLALKEQAGQIQQLQAKLKAAQLDFQQISAKLQQLQQPNAMVTTANTPIPQQPVLEPINIKIVAPIAGTVVELPMSTGDQIFTGNKLLGIANAKQLKIGVDLNPQQAGLLKSGQKAAIKFGIESENQELKGVISNIALPADRSTQHVEVEFTNPTSTMLVGQVGTVYFPK
jgi:hemolysin D